MKKIEVIEYSPIYAQSIAEMWNKSGDNWGGSNTVVTEQNILEEHEGAAHLSVFLALDNRDVVGYCSFSKYAEDEGALYIPLLNARPDYHGQGVGKALVLKAVEKTIELGWPRLDLYTWPGNTKAVPLYKKCGFFWERRDDTTHLINLIPYALNTEAVKDFFETAHWYEDSKRHIELKPDGKSENEFDYFEYSWEKNGKNLRMEFERRGRGLRLIETDDYLIKATVENLKLVFGKSYKVYYDIINKSGNPLSIEIKGADNKNIKYSFEKSIEVADSQKLVGEFRVDEIHEEQSEWRTHPVVSTEIIINGKKAQFKTGIVPKHPAKISMVVPHNRGTLNEAATAYIDIENNINQSVSFEFELLDNKNITFLNKKMNIKMEPLERKSVDLTYILKDFCLYKINAEIKAIFNNEAISFKKELTGIFKGYSNAFGGETEDCWFMTNGNTIFKLKKFDNELTLKADIDDEYGTFIMYPKLGKPFSTEFSRIKPHKVNIYNSNNFITMDAYYRSEDFKNIEFKTIAKLYTNGILEHYYEVSNTSQKSTSSEMWINDSIFNELYRTVIPYEGRYIEIDNSFYGQMDFWDSSKLTENWIFSKSHKISRGISWGKNSKAVFEGWFMRLENNIGILNANETKRTEAVYWAVGAFENWKNFREFALNNSNSQNLQISSHFDFVINNNNPFVNNCFNIDVMERKLAYFNGSLNIRSKYNNISASKSFKEEQKETKTNFDCSVEYSKAVDKITLSVDFDDIEFEKHKTIFIKNDNTINTVVLKEENMDVHVIDNGALTIKAAAQFSNAIFSIKYNGSEWLDSSFPTPIPKSWFNPWTGGIDTRPNRFMPASAALEEREVTFAELKDSVGNLWKGIKTSLTIEKNQTYKGLKINQYYMLLPGVSVLCYISEFIQNTGKYFDDLEYVNFSFLKAGEDITKCWVKVADGNGEVVKHKCGKVRQDIHTSTFLQYGSQERKDKICVVTDTKDIHQIAFANNQIIASLIVDRINIKDGSSVFTRPVFFILGEEEFEYTSLADLLKIRFCTAGENR